MSAKTYYEVVLLLHLVLEIRSLGLINVSQRTFMKVSNVYVNNDNETIYQMVRSEQECSFLCASGSHCSSVSVEPLDNGLFKCFLHNNLHEGFQLDTQNGSSILGKGKDCSLNT